MSDRGKGGKQDARQVMLSGADQEGAVVAEPRCLWGQEFFKFSLQSKDALHADYEQALFKVSSDPLKFSYWPIIR